MTKSWGFDMKIVERNDPYFNGYYVYAEEEIGGRIYDYAKLYTSKSAYEQNKDKFMHNAVRALERTRQKLQS